MFSKRLICVFCAVLFMLAAVGCGAPSGNQADTDAVNAALDKFRDCSSFTFTQITYSDETIALDGDKINCAVTNQTQFSLITEPSLQMKAVTTSHLDYDGELEEQSTASYIYYKNGEYKEYVNDGLAWYTFTTDDGQAVMGMNASSVANTFYADRISFANVGEETLEGGKATHYKGVLGGDELLAMLDSNGYLVNISSMSENQQAQIRKNLLKDLDDVTVSVWVDAKTGYPVRFEVVMTGLLKQLNESIAKSLGNKEADSEWTVNECYISMSLSDFDALEEIVLPPEAANATPYEGV